MFANLVKRVTITCPECNTSIRFDIHPGSEYIQELFGAISTLTCPKCKEPLASDAQDMIRTIHEYNGAVSKLSEMEKATCSKLD